MIIYIYIYIILWCHFDTGRSRSLGTGPNSVLGPRSCGEFWGGSPKFSDNPP